MWRSGQPPPPDFPPPPGRGAAEKVAHGLRLKGAKGGTYSLVALSWCLQVAGACWIFEATQAIRGRRLAGA